MGRKFATGKHAYGLCDRCGFRYRLKELRRETVNRNLQNFLVCRECWNPDHPQLHIGELDGGDSYGLNNPRPQIDLAASRDGEDVIWNFTEASDVNLFIHRDSTPGGDNGSVSHDSANGWMNWQWSQDTDARLVLTGESDLFAAADYDLCQIRLKFNSFDSDARWEGQCFFGRSTDASFPFDISRRERTGVPASGQYYQMGESFLILEWDLSRNENYNGIIHDLRWDLYSIRNDGSGSSANVDIDWIKVLKNPE